MFNQRRIFISCGEEAFQIFSFGQEKDGSIYCSWPDFKDSRILKTVNTPDGIGVAVFTPQDDGKLTIHGSGMAGYREHNNKYHRHVVIPGNYLKPTEGDSLGMRHLFTAVIKKPVHLPTSPFGNRESDYLINAQKIEPSVLFFFAVPITNFAINFQIKGAASDLIPEGGTAPSVLGFHLFELRQHLVFWIAYKTRHMEKWPLDTHVVYDNGFKVPLIFGEEGNKFRFELRVPTYKQEGSEMVISI